MTLDDPELMREIVAALIDDTSRQMALLDVAIPAENSKECVRLAHYSKARAPTSARIPTPLC